MGIQGSDSADPAAKRASETRGTNSNKPFRLEKHHQECTGGKVEAAMETCRDKQREIKPEPEIWIDIGKYSRRDKVIFSRMRWDILC